MRWARALEVEVVPPLEPDPLDEVAAADGREWLMGNLEMRLLVEQIGVDPWSLR